jgi:hypothetical protein
MLPSVEADESAILCSIPSRVDGRQGKLAVRPPAWGQPLREALNGLTEHPDQAGYRRALMSTTSAARLELLRARERRAEPLVDVEERVESTRISSNETPPTCTAASAVHEWYVPPRQGRGRSVKVPGEHFGRVMLGLCSWPAYREIVDVPSAAMSTSTESDFSLGPFGSTVMLAVM